MKYSKNYNPVDETFGKTIPDMNKKGKYKNYLLGLLLVFLLAFGIFVLVFVLKKNQDTLFSVEVVGYKFNVEFDPMVFEYELNIDKEEVEILCKNYKSISGCNSTIDMSGKEKYDHKIEVVTKDNKTYNYIVHINKIINKESNSLENINNDAEKEPIENNITKKINIESVNFDKMGYTNDKIVLTVIATGSNNLQYSFDNGKTWQTSNKYTVTENKELKIIVKDNDNNKSGVKTVKIDKIDKEIPTVEIKIKTKTTNRIVLSANAKDDISGINSYSWNDSSYSNESTYVVTKAGTYTLKVKDNAGNISKTANIVITQNDLNPKKNTKTYTVNITPNGASVSSDKVSCTTENLKCKVKLPTITRSGYTILGYAESKNATSAKYKSSEEIELTGNKTLYAITSKKVTATFDPNNLTTTLSSKTISCTIYNSSTKCDITLPTFTKIGHFDRYWGKDSKVSKNLSGYSYDSSYFLPSGSTVSISENTTFYPNFNNSYYTYSGNYYKFRSFSISSTNKIGSTRFEYESGIPTYKINAHKSFLNNVYTVFPFLFVPSKVFVLTNKTYSNYSAAYGLTAFGLKDYPVIDIQYDSSGEISENATIHELSHAWDYYYSYKTGKGRINKQSDFQNFYKSIDSKLYVSSSGEKITDNEVFAAMVTNYYWHILGKDNSKTWYGLCSGCSLSSSEQAQLKSIMDKYIKISNNNYK